jgi:flagellar basal body-associated protein FliL
MVLAVIAINSATTGGLVAVTLRRPAGVGPAVVKAADAAPGPMLRMEPLVIQLRRGGQDSGERYLRVAFDLEMKNDHDRSAFLSRMSRINDSLITYFSDRTAADLRGGDGLVAIKDALTDRLRPILPGHLPKKVYITDFLIQ